jgi:hypothetical protein
MDLSKLPKFSQTPPPPGQSEAPAPAEPTMKTEGGQTGGAKVELFCRCGAPITPGTNFCSHCGANYYEAVGGRGADRNRDRSEFTGGGMWIEAFLSIAVGLFLMLIAPNGIRYMTATLMGKPFTPYDHPEIPNQKVDYLRYKDLNTGVVTDYTYRSMFDAFWSDMCVTSFALALILEGIVMALIRNRWVVLASALLIVGVTLLNIWYVAASYTRTSPITKQSYPLPLISVLAIIFGVVMAGYQFMLFSELRAARKRS